MEFISIKQLQSFAKKVSKKIGVGDSIYLYGDLGSGKTTFARFLINSIQSNNKVKKDEVLSPTFTLVQYYNIKKISIAHYDLYRIKKKKDLFNLGIFEQEDSFINIIEWPELIENKNIDRIEIFLKYTKNQKLRKYYAKYFGRFKKK